jgi:hypothetical protein
MTARFSTQSPPQPPPAGACALRDTSQDSWQLKASQGETLTVLGIWAGMFTDNCSEYDVPRLYEHYVLFASLLHIVPVVDRRYFEAYTVIHAPMGLHDSDDTRSLIKHLDGTFHGPVI